MHDFDYESLSQREKVELMLACGMHHSHQRVAAYFKPFLMQQAQGSSIIDISYTIRLLDRAVREIKTIFAGGGSVVFVTTKQQVSSIGKREAKRCGQYWVSKKWIGGMLTNMKYAVRGSLDTLASLIEASDDHVLYTKKERNSFVRKHQSRFALLEGVSGEITATKPLDKSNIKLVVVVDPVKEFTAIQEVLSLRKRDEKRYPVLIVLGDGFAGGGDKSGRKFHTRMLGNQDIFIPVNDDGSTSVEFVTIAIANAIAATLQENAEKVESGTLKDEILKKLDGHHTA